MLGPVAGTPAEWRLSLGDRGKGNGGNLWAPSARGPSLITDALDPVHSNYDPLAGGLMLVGPTGL